MPFKIWKEDDTMTPLQQCQLRLLGAFVETCQKLGLRYYMVCGSALGAVKYGGFIPWDDDIDVAMPRPDYEQFLEKAQTLLPEGVFLQNYRTDPRFPLLFSKLRDSNTTFVEEVHKNLPMNHGVYIDVFPLDGYPEAEGSRKRFERKKAAFERQRKVVLDYDRWQFPKAVRTNGTYLLYRLFGLYKNTAKTLERYNAFLAAWPVEDSSLWCNHGNWQGPLEYAPKGQYGQGVPGKFEGLDVILPQDWDAYLTQKYGDWRRDPPPENQKSHHSFAICDLEHPYTHFYAKEE